ncbi:MAG: transcriptional regulator PpsR [Pseudomonadota bacterium]
MDTPRRTKQRIQTFRHAKRFFSDVDAALVARLVASGVDVALIVIDGTIKDMSASGEQILQAGCLTYWRNKPWTDVSTPESAIKIADLASPTEGDIGRWRQLTMLDGTGEQVPIKFTSVRLPTDGAVLALGQDLRSVASLQQRLISMHQDLEREYTTLRDAEARYRVLFHALSDPALIVRVADGQVTEINAAALQRFGLADAQPKSLHLNSLFPAEDQAAVQRMLERTATQGSGDAPSVSVRRKRKGTLKATAFRQGAEVFAMVQVEAAASVSAAASSEQPDPFAGAVNAILDGLVVATPSMHILSANRAFLQMLQVADDRQIIGTQLSQWIGRSSVELNMLDSSLSRRGTARNFATVVRDRFGDEDEVEISASTTRQDGEPAYIFSIRATARRLAGSAQNNGSWLPSTADQVTSMVGQLPLKDIVRASADVIEKVCIEAALEISQDSRASAAELLGLSRQGLYSKLKRHGMSGGD